MSDREVHIRFCERFGGEIRLGLLDSMFSSRFNLIELLNDFSLRYTLTNNLFC